MSNIEYYDIEYAADRTNGLFCSKNIESHYYGSLFEN